MPAASPPTSPTRKQGLTDITNESNPHTDDPSKSSIQAHGPAIPNSLNPTAAVDPVAVAKTESWLANPEAAASWLEENAAADMVIAFGELKMPKAAMVQTMKDCLAACPDMVFNNTPVTLNGDGTVSYSCEVSGTHTGAAFGFHGHPSISAAGAKCKNDREKVTLTYNVDGLVTKCVVEAEGKSGPPGWYSCMQEHAGQSNNKKAGMQEKLTSLGLPLAQAQASAAACAAPYTPSPTGHQKCHVYGMLKIKGGEDISAKDMDALREGLQEYADAARQCEGQVYAQYGIAGEEVYFNEVYDSPAAMDIHIGHCFPAYTKIVPHATMTELVCTCDASEVEFWKTSAAAWGASKFVVTAVIGGEGLKAAAAAKVEALCALGLPRAQAERSVRAAADPARGHPTMAKATGGQQASSGGGRAAASALLRHRKKACSVYAALKVKDGISDADMLLLKAAVDEYGSAARACDGQVSAQYGVSGGEVQFFEIYDSPEAMDIHIGCCFPAYTKILPHATMAEIVCTCDASEVEFWKTSAAAWGASKFVVTKGI